MFCTDTWFGSTPAIGGYTCSQLYYGVKSKYMVLYPMHKESDGPDTLEDLCRYHGAPVKIKNDNAQMEVGTTWTTICRKYNIEQAKTEPHHPWQNEAERYIQEVKKTVNTIMDRVGCPNKFWALCSLYVVFLLNRIANPELNWRTPMEACFGITPDLSPLLIHSFFDKVYYLDAEVPFPQSKEKLGRFVGIAENTGDALTFLIYIEGTEQVIARSVIRTAEDPTTPNKRVDQHFNRDTHVANKVIGMKDIIPNATLTVIDPDSLVGYSFVGEHAG
jgi:hypothetical protein